MRPPPPPLDRLTMSQGGQGWLCLKEDTGTPLPEVVVEEDPPPEMVVEEDPPEVVVEEDPPPPEVVVEEDPSRSGSGRGPPHRSGSGRGPPPPRQGPDQTSWEVLLGKAGGMP